jgi:hypothetical protein
VIALFIDEDSMSRALVQGLRERGVDVTTVQDQGTRGRSDADQLELASGLGRVLFSRNVADFSRLHARYLRSAVHHAGIVVDPEPRSGFGDQIHRLVKLASSKQATEMVDTLEYLTNWR